MNLRTGRKDDEDWLFQLFSSTMQDYIDDAWGWDELFQREGFVTSLPATKFQVLEFAGKAVGSYHLTDRGTHYLLDMIMVIPEQQRKGYGKLMMKQIKRQSIDNNKPICLSVLKSNPAIQFYLSEGFQKKDDDEHSISMAWPGPDS